MPLVPLPEQLKETIIIVNMNALADLVDSVKIIPFSMFERLGLVNLRETTMLVEMTDMIKKSLRGIVEYVVIITDKFVFLVDFVIIDMVGDTRKTLISRRPFLETVHLCIDVFNKQISLVTENDRFLFELNETLSRPPTSFKSVCMAETTQEEESFNLLRIAGDLFSYESPLYIEFENFNCMLEINESNYDVCTSDTNPIMVKSGDLNLFWPTCDPYLEECNRGDSINIKDKNDNPKQWECFCDNERQGVKCEGIDFYDWVMIRFGNIEMDSEAKDMMYVEWLVQNYQDPHDDYIDETSTTPDEVTVYIHRSSYGITTPENEYGGSDNYRAPNIFLDPDYYFASSTRKSGEESKEKNLKVHHCDPDIAFCGTSYHITPSYDSDLEACPNGKEYDDRINQIEQLADEYELRMGKKGDILQDIWDKCGEVATAGKDERSLGKSSNHLENFKILEIDISRDLDFAQGSQGGRC
ncbi:reverse transcriptase domain-containing protein [Tanacetum coccineum]|uniref:Reverse transcriptase domain-containing protein n=1 Tax=Tanacetum coccineum TaxID=301880 RepID=A0ABQ5CHY8_9ASTR